MSRENQFDLIIIETGPGVAHSLTTWLRRASGFSSWSSLIQFHEYFHGDPGRGVGASHQTGWTGLVAKLLQQSGEPAESRKRERRLAFAD
jgi:hypothetical protein